VTYSLADFVKFAQKLRTEEGTPLSIAEFQKKLLRPYFRGTRETLIVLPTGNGKTTLLAALGIYHMLRVKNATVLIVASAADQAGTLFKQMRTLIVESDYADLLDVKYGIRVIYHKGSGPNNRPPGEIRVIASEVGKQEGAIPTLVLVDELHAHKDLAMYEMLRDKLWKRGHEKGCGRMVAISTAGFSFDSPLWKLKVEAEQLPDYRRQGMVSTASGTGFAWIEHGLGPDENREDMGLVAKANPAPWITKANLTDRRASFTMSKGEWARSACNVWTASAEPAITPEEWDALRTDAPWQVKFDEEVWLAPSVGHNAAVALAAPREDGKIAVHVEHLDAEDGKSILVRTEDLIADLCERYRVVEAHVPMGGFRRSLELLEMRGVPVVEAPHSPQRLVEFSGTLNRLLRSGSLTHARDPVTRAQVLAAQTKTTETGERYIQEDRSRAVIAIAAACHAASAPFSEPAFILPTGVMG
jgi:hypothetical protein